MGLEIKETSNAAVKKVVGTQIPAALYEKLRAEAETDFMSISDLLRKIIYLYYRDKEVADVDADKNRKETEN